MRQMHAKFHLESFTEHMSTRVPEGLAAFRVIELEELNLAIAFQRARCIVVHPAFANVTLFLFGVLQGIVKGSYTALGVSHLSYDDLLRQLTRDLLGDVEGRCHERRAFLDVAIG